MATFDVSDLLAYADPVVPSIDVRKAAPVPKSSTHGKRFLDPFACPLRRHASWRMCDESCHTFMNNVIASPSRSADLWYYQMLRSKQGTAMLLDSLRPKIAPLTADDATLLREFTTLGDEPAAAVRDSIFFRLPPELRNNVYDLVLHSAIAHDAHTFGIAEPRVPQDPSAVQPHAVPPSATIPHPSACKPLPALLLSCKLIREESAKLYVVAVDHELGNTVPAIEALWAQRVGLRSNLVCGALPWQTYRVAAIWNARQARAIRAWCTVLRAMKKSGEAALEAAFDEC